MNAQKLEQVQKVFANDRFATENGVVIDEVDDGYAKCSLEIQPHHLNAGGTVMGGAIFTLADFAFAVASNWNKPLNVSTTSQITFLGTAKGARLVAEARKVKEGRSTCYYLVDVSDDLGNPVAHVTASGFVKSDPAGSGYAHCRKRIMRIYILFIIPHYGAERPDIPHQNCPALSIAMLMPYSF